MTFMAPKPTVVEGEVYPTKQGNVKVIKYYSALRVKIKFIDDSGYTTITRAELIRKGSVKNPYCKTICDVGYFGEGSYKCGAKNSREYALFRAMLSRCYDSKEQIKHPTYEGCSVDPRWHNFQNFAEDIRKMPNWDTLGFELDKDLRVLKNKIYGPKYCSFVPKEINKLVNRLNAKGFSRRRDTGKYRVFIGMRGVTESRGGFSSKKKAYRVYCLAKAKYIKEIAKEHKQNIHKEVYKTLIALSEGYHEKSKIKA